MKYLLIAALVVTATAAEAKRRPRTYNPFSVDFEHRTARMAREQGTPRVMYNGGYVPQQQYGTTTIIRNTVNLGR